MCAKWKSQSVWTAAVFVYQALFLHLVSVPVFISQLPVLLLCEQGSFVCEQLTPLKLLVVSRGRQGLVSQLNKLLSMGSNPWLKSIKKTHPVEILEMMNSWAHRELIAFEVNRCQNACEGRREYVEWPDDKQNAQTHALQTHTYMHESTSAHTSYHNNMFCYVTNPKLTAAVSSSCHLSRQ